MNSEAVGRRCELALEVTADRRIGLGGHVVELARGSLGCSAQPFGVTGGYKSGIFFVNTGAESGVPCSVRRSNAG